MPGSDQIHFLDGGQWVNAPSWVQFLLNLGYVVAREAEVESRRVVVVAVPTRSYATALIAAGIVGALAAEASGDDTSELFHQLRKLPKGTSVILQEGNKTFKGQLIGCEDRRGTEYIGVQLQASGAGGRKTWLPPERVAQITVTGGTSGNLPKNPQGTKIVVAQRFLGRFLNGLDPRRFSTTSRLDCAIVGRLGVLRQEVMVKLAFPGTGSRFDSGTLQDVLRVRRFVRSGQSYRSIVVPIERGTPDTRSKVVLFDGALAALKCRHQWRSSDQIVVLDRTDPNFEAATDALNAEYARYRLEYAPEDIISGWPVGVEVMNYSEWRQ
jgi:hypothetical protein